MNSIHRFAIPLCCILAAALSGACGEDGEDQDGTGTPDAGGETPGFTAADYFGQAARAITTGQDPQLPSLSLAAPSLVPPAGSPAANGAATPGGFFQPAPYLGAFEPGGANWMEGWTAFAPNAQSTVAAGANIVVVDANITEDTTWTADNVYQLTAAVYVTNAVLTIEPGTLIIGDNATALIITQTARLEADGRADAPIVFTSSQEPGSRQPGDWGGVVLLGQAPINVGTNNIEGLVATQDAAYGGQNAAHNCGTLRYVRIEWAGFVFGTDNELNSLTLGGCGSDTTLEYIQTHRGEDDGIEFFGGNANLRYAVVTGTRDDALDWDEGYTGNVQFFVCVQDPNEGDRCIEADNNRSAPIVTPVSNPTVWNITLVGGGSNPEQVGAILRAGTSGSLHNAIITNFGRTGVRFDGAETLALAESGALDMTNILFFANGADF